MGIWNKGVKYMILGALIIIIILLLIIIWELLELLELGKPRKHRNC